MTETQKDINEIKTMLKKMSIFITDIIHTELNDIDKQMNEKIHNINKKTENIKQIKLQYNKGKFATEKADQYIRYTEESIKAEQNELQRLHERYVDLFLVFYDLTDHNENEEMTEFVENYMQEE